MSAGIEIKNCTYNYIFTSYNWLYPFIDTCNKDYINMNGDSMKGIGINMVIRVPENE